MPCFLCVGADPPLSPCTPPELRPVFDCSLRGNNIYGIEVSPFSALSNTLSPVQNSAGVEAQEAPSCKSLLGR